MGTTMNADETGKNKKAFLIYSATSFIGNRSPTTSKSIPRNMAHLTRWCAHPKPSNRYHRCRIARVRWPSYLICMPKTLPRLTQHVRVCIIQRHLSKRAPWPVRLCRRHLIIKKKSSRLYPTQNDAKTLPPDPFHSAPLLIPLVTSISQ